MAAQIGLTPNGEFARGKLGRRASRANARLRVCTECKLRILEPPVVTERVVYEHGKGEGIAVIPAAD